MALFSYSEEGVQTFAVLYTMGNVVALCSGLFLMGPGRQCDRMYVGSPADQRGSALASSAKASVLAWWYERV
eukprot:scaffold1954_cov268-Pinguiococcus_pyrenoidosus.AAC.267